MTYANYLCRPAAHGVHSSSFSRISLNNIFTSFCVFRIFRNIFIAFECLYIFAHFEHDSFSVDRDSRQSIPFVLWREIRAWDIKLKSEIESDDKWFVISLTTFVIVIDWLIITLTFDS